MLADKDIWIISEEVAPKRRERLLNPPSHKELITNLKVDFQSAIEQGNFSTGWKQGRDNKNFWRFEGTFPLLPETYDLIFNARNGYRAQYYLDSLVGKKFNDWIIAELTPCIQDAKDLPEPHDAVMKSIGGPYSKIWTGGDGAEWITGNPALFVPRWKDHWDRQEGQHPEGLMLPLPEKPALDVKGSWFDPKTESYYDIKKDRGRDRDQELHIRGST